MLSIRPPPQVKYCRCACDLKLFTRNTLYKEPTALQQIWNRNGLVTYFILTHSDQHGFCWSLFPGSSHGLRYLGKCKNECLFWQRWRFCLRLLSLLPLKHNQHSVKATGLHILRSVAAPECKMNYRMIRWSIRILTTWAGFLKMDEK